MHSNLNKWNRKISESCSSTRTPTFPWGQGDGQPLSESAMSSPQTSLLSLLISHLAVRKAAPVLELLRPSSFCTNQNHHFPLCLLLQNPQREDFTSAFLFKPKSRRPKPLAGVHGHSLRSGAQLTMATACGSWPLSGSVGRDFTRKDLSWDNWHL